MKPKVKNLVTKQPSVVADNLFEDVLADMRVYSTQWIVQQVDVTVLIDGSRHRDTLLLAATQIYSLQNTNACVHLSALSS